MFFLIVLGIIATAALYFGRRHFLKIRNVHRLPGPPSRNLLTGNIQSLFDSQENNFKTVRKWGLDYYPIYKNWCAHMAIANVCNPYDSEKILSNMKHNTKAEMYDVIHSWLGTGLLTSKDKKWQNRRKLLTPAFHFNILQEFIKVFKDETKKLVDLLNKEGQKPFIEVTQYISDFTLNTIAESSMGISLDKKSSKSLNYIEAIRLVGELYMYRTFHPWFWNKFLYVLHPNYYKEVKLVKTLHEFTKEVISERQKRFQSTGQLNYSQRKRMAMLDLLLTAKAQDSSIDDEGIREEVDTFMFEGHDTTSAAISFILMLLACNANIQNRVVVEMEEVFGSSSRIDYQTLQDLKYMEMCIKEALRLYPSVSSIGRILGEDIVTNCGRHLNVGTPVHIHIYDLHHNPNIYPDPEKFDPDRFLPENCQSRHHFAYLPFSAGPRNCIGQRFAMLELKTVLCGVLSEFILEPVDTPESIVLILDMILRTKDAIRIKFVKRTNKTFTLNDLF